MKSKKKIIIDTDIGPDCDDAAALAMANIYHKRGWVDVLAVIHCTSNPWGVGAIRRINQYYGHAFDVATLKDENFLVGKETEKYNKTLALSSPTIELEATDAVALYRKLLAAAEDRSIEIVAIGPLRNLGNLLASSADEYSHLDGLSLVKEKVSRLVSMAGRFDYVKDSEIEPAAEWNVLMDIPSMQQVCSLWPSEIIFSGFEVGVDILTGAKMCHVLKSDHPVKMAYDLYTNGENRMSWDLATLQYTTEPDCPDYSLSKPGQIVVSDDGVTHWTADNTGKHFYMVLESDVQDIADKLDDLLCSFE